MSGCCKTRTTGFVSKLLPMRLTRREMRWAYQCSQVVPHFRNVGIEADGTRVCVEGVAVLINLVVQHADGAPECGVAPVAVNGLLVGLVRLGKLLLRHVAASEQVPALRIGLVCCITR